MLLADLVSGRSKLTVLYVQVQSELQTTFHGCIKRVLIPELNPPADLDETIKTIFSTASNVSVVKLLL